MLNAPSLIADELNKAHAEILSRAIVAKFRWSDWRVAHGGRDSYLIGRDEDRSLLIFYRPSGD